MTRLRGSVHELPEESVYSSADYDYEKLTVPALYSALVSGLIPVTTKDNRETCLRKFKQHVHQQPITQADPIMAGASNAIPGFKQDESKIHGRTSDSRDGAAPARILRSQFAHIPTQVVLRPKEIGSVTEIDEDSTKYSYASELRRTPRVMVESSILGQKKPNTMSNTSERRWNWGPWLWTGVLMSLVLFYISGTH